MNWIDRAERYLGHLAIPHFIRVITAFNALVFILYRMLNPHLVEVLSLAPEAIRHGQVWRLVTFIFIPTIGGPLFDWITVFFYIWFLWMLGDGLEEAMGSFRVNLFYLVGMIGTVAAAFITNGGGFAVTMINSSLLFAFAHYYPDLFVYLMGFIPIKVKWLAWVTAAFLIFGFIVGGWDYRLALIAAFTNYFLFFGWGIVQGAAQRHGVRVRRSRFEAAQRSDGEAMHRCATCGRTDIQAPDLEFRVARDGQEYCVDHLPKPSPPPAQ